MERNQPNGGNGESSHTEPVATPESGVDGLQDTTPERQPRNPNRIYVASLTDYNNGVLHGTWVDAEQDADAITAEVKAMLARSPTAAELGEAAEEWAIHDYDGDAFNRLPIREGEWLSDIARIARLAGEHGEPFIVLAQHAGLDDLDFLEAAVRDSFVGHWPSVEAFAEHVFDDMGAPTFITNSPAHLRPFVLLDTAKMAEQLKTELTILGGPDGVYVFNPSA